MAKRYKIVYLWRGERHVGSFYEKPCKESAEEIKAYRAKGLLAWLEGLS